MSSIYVRNTFKNYLTTNLPALKFIDLTGEFEELNKMLTRNGVGISDPWNGIQFIASDEEPITISNQNNSGKFREFGAIYIHIVERARLGVADLILSTATTITNLLRSSRIGDILILKITPPNFESGATLDFEGGYISASLIISYQRDLNL